MSFWQLVAAHSIPLHLIIALLPKLKEKQHTEALTAIMLMIKHERYNFWSLLLVYIFSGGAI